jgi:hypothetical protein
VAFADVKNGLGRFPASWQIESTTKYGQIEFLCELLLPVRTNLWMMLWLSKNQGQHDR